MVDWSPYTGTMLTWRIASTFLHGEMVAADGKVFAEPGTGRFLSPASAPGAPAKTTVPAYA